MGVAASAMDRWISLNKSLGRPLAPIAKRAYPYWAAAWGALISDYSIGYDGDRHEVIVAEKAAGSVTDREMHAARGLVSISAPLAAIAVLFPIPGASPIVAGILCLLMYPFIAGDMAIEDTLTVRRAGEASDIGGAG